VARSKQQRTEAISESMHWALYYLSIFPALDQAGWIFPTGEGHPTRQTLEALRAKSLTERGELRVSSLVTKTNNFVWKLTERGKIKLAALGRPALDENGELIEAAILAITGKEIADG
jgi:hypothetical protein